MKLVKRTHCLIFGYIVDEDQQESEEFDIKEGCIYYGMSVKIVSTNSGLALPILVNHLLAQQ